MGPIAIVFGIILVVVGVGGYLATMTSLTALIPAALGLILIVLGFLARKEKLRKHVMHAAVLVGLIGLAGGGWRAVKALTSEEAGSPIALGMNIAMAAICAVFVVLCVKSFIDARKRRKQTGA